MPRHSRFLTAGFYIGAVSLSAFLVGWSIGYLLDAPSHSELNRLRNRVAAADADFKRFQTIGELMFTSDLEGLLLVSNRRDLAADVYKLRDKLITCHGLLVDYEEQVARFVGVEESAWRQISRVLAGRRRARHVEVDHGWRQACEEVREAIQVVLDGCGDVYLTLEQRRRLQAVVG